MANSKIEWTGETWNPTTGCTKISSGCKYCYAEIMSRRLQAMGMNKYINGFDLTIHTDTLKLPYKWKKSRLVFVNSMSDLFHEDLPFEFIQKVFSVMNDNQQHIFQILTKRSDILLKYNSFLNWTPNIWMGVTVENNQYLKRIEDLRWTNAAIKFLSLEPLLGPVPDINLAGIDWVIVGGESGTNPRPIKKEWVTDILAQCREQNVSFFFKQWGGRNKKQSGRFLNNKIYNEMPVEKYLYLKHKNVPDLFTAINE